MTSINICGSLTIPAMAVLRARPECRELIICQATRSNHFSSTREDVPKAAFRWTNTAYDFAKSHGDPAQLIFAGIIPDADGRIQDNTTPDYRHWRLVRRDIFDAADRLVAAERLTQRAALEDFKAYLRENDTLTKITLVCEENSEPDSFWTWPEYMAEIVDIIAERANITSITLQGAFVMDVQRGAGQARAAGRAFLDALCRMIRTKTWIRHLRIKGKVFADNSQCTAMQAVAAALGESKVEKASFDFSAIGYYAGPGIEAVLQLLTRETSLTHLQFGFSYDFTSVFKQMAIVNALIAHPTLQHTDVTRWLDRRIVIERLIPYCTLLQSMKLNWENFSLAEWADLCRAVEAQTNIMSLDITTQPSGGFDLKGFLADRRDQQNMLGIGLK